VTVPLPPLVDGVRHVVRKSDLEELRLLVRSRPNSPQRVLDRLGEANARIARRSSETVSPECVASYLPPTANRTGSQSVKSKQYGHVPPSVDLLRLVLLGFNTVPLHRSFMAT
jgi:hypothetical protein